MFLLHSEQLRSNFLKQTVRKIVSLNSYFCLKTYAPKFCIFDKKASKGTDNVLNLIFHLIYYKVELKMACLLIRELSQLFCGVEEGIVL